ncbi:DUF1501 domain-containing protein [Paenibacillus sp. YYML68]|uniref:DUF1501 domain-containing protein n=1 Tax=Paenibacillus sp. YYML68 TaxID=2909250 RepID=UPI00248F65E2|nr:DUF1501 domain-containing protein [Paenibacillus sp. YYML68]
MKINRRQFLAGGTAFVAALTAGAWSLSNGTWLPKAQGGQAHAASGSASGRQPVLVILQLAGGNDGLNTVIPYGQGAYFDARPTLAYAEKDVLALNGGLGLHPSLTGLKKRWDEGKLAIVQGTGYPQPNRSHFRSKDIWQTAVAERVETSGWIGRYMQTELAADPNPLKAIEIGKLSSKALKSGQVSAPLLQSIETYQWLNPNTSSEEKNRLARAFQSMYGLQLTNTKIRVTADRGADAYASVEAIQSLSSKYQETVTYPDTAFAADLQLIVKLLSSGAGTRVFWAELDGFDDHADERGQHADLLKEYDEAVSAFYDDLQSHGLADDVVVMTYSEFGRRVKENGSGGTDHGAAAPVFVLGGRVKGGLYGEYPSLTRLDSNGDLTYNVDFRSIYASMLDDWLGADSKDVLGARYETIKLFT